jgi:FkbM family methyltransferase
MAIKEKIKAGLKNMSGRLNYTRAVVLNNKRFIIPVIKNMGLLNLKVRDDWFSQMLSFIRLPSDGVFIDIGVNVGQTLLAFKSRSEGAYFGFEPNPACVYYVNELITVNRLENARVLPVGLSNVTCLGKFYRKGQIDSAGTTVSELRPDYYTTEQVSYVPLFRFDDLHLGIGTVSLIKVDVEGAELEVLQGLESTIRKDKPLIICEILDAHSQDNVAPMQKRADQLMGFVRSNGYQVYRINSSSRNIVFEKQDQVKLKLWEPASWHLNDYLFVPAGTALPWLPAGT